MVYDIVDAELSTDRFVEFREEEKQSAVATGIALSGKEVWIFPHKIYY